MTDVACVILLLLPLFFAVICNLINMSSWIVELEHTQQVLTSRVQFLEKCLVEYANGYKPE